MGSNRKPAPPPLLEQDRLLPTANVAKIMAEHLPKNAKVARESKKLMQELVTEFLCFVTSEANDICLAAGRNAISALDVEHAFLELGA